MLVLNRKYLCVPDEAILVLDWAYACSDFASRFRPGDILGGRTDGRNEFEFDPCDSDLYNASHVQPEVS